MSKYYIATPIYYVNDKPHIGHAYTTLTADVLSRYHRLRGDNVLFATGVDENAQKTVVAAEAAGQEIHTYLDDMANLWKSTWESINISFDNFTRTTSEAHKRTVHELIRRVTKSGDIYKDKYIGFYCVGCEAFIKESELVNGCCALHKKKPEWIEEENYFFKLSRYQRQLLDYIEQNPDFIRPKSRRNEVVSFIKQGLQDFSVSRSTQKWGIVWPGDPKQVVYVWFDALSWYLTAAGFPNESYKQFWPIDLHVVGKDIIKFHCIYWPAMLLSAGIELPKQVFAHGFFTIDGQKISKSLGNAIDPKDLTSDKGNDTLRYYLFSEIPFGEDGEFNRQRFDAVYKTDLSNDLGNLVQRVAVLVDKNMSGIIGDLPRSTIETKPYHDAIANLQLTLALKEVWQHIRDLNVYLQQTKPWETVKSDKKLFEEQMKRTVTDILLIAELLTPFLPDTASKIRKTFGTGTVDLKVGLLFPQQSS